jgi:tripartite-type tricarboxylate transporter receptor subunit TctC
MQCIRSILVLAAFLLADGSAYAQSAASYPTRPVRMIVPFVPGGATDFVARVIQPRLSEELGQPVVVENRAGASGNIGVEIAARATPDGYTVLLGNIGAMAINPALFRKFPIQPVRDFVCLCPMVDIPTVFVVHAAVPVTTLKEFIDYAKAKPGQINYASTGAGSNSRMSMEYIMNKAGIKLVNVPYSGGGAATTALLSGEVSVSVFSVASLIPHARSGRLKGIAVIAPKRIDALPEMPTLAESGFPELTLGSWQAVFVSAPTPLPIVKKLHTIVGKVMADNAVVQRLRAGGAEPIGIQSLEKCAAFIKAQNEFWAKLVKQVGVTAEQ